MTGRHDLTHEEYDELLKPMGEELSAMARWVSETKQRMIILFEGRDTAGKGGSIDMFARVLNPRQCRIVALPSPNERERTQWYFQRYVRALPARKARSCCSTAAGTIAPVSNGLWASARPSKRRTFSTRCPSSSGRSSTKAFCSSNIGCAATRTCRKNGSRTACSNPMKRWKLSPIDIKAREHYDDYTEAREMMLSATHTDFAPWTLVDFNDQPLGRLTLLRDLLDRIPDTELAARRYSVAALVARAAEGALRRAAAHPILFSRAAPAPQARRARRLGALALIRSSRRLTT